MSRRRSNRVAEDLAIAVAFIAGAVGALAPPEPTGRPLVDAILVGVAIGVVVWAGASAAWWVVAGAAAVAMVIAIDPLLVGIAAVALGIAVWIGVRRRNMPEWRAVSVALSINVLAWSELDGFLGLSAAIAVVTAIAVFVLGVRRRPRRIRRRAWVASGVVAGATVVVLVAFGAAVAGSRSDLEQGQQFAEDAIDLLNTGDFNGAAERFEQASEALATARDRLDRPWVAPAAAIPVISQHQAAAQRLSDAGADATQRVATALRQVDPEALRVNTGAIDLAAVTALEEPFAQVDAALAELSTDVARSRSPWLVAAVTDELDSLAERLAENEPRLENARLAIDLAPGLLGGTEPRRYLVLFTTPAEARGLGGFPGNYAELTVDGGQLAMGEFGRVSDLEARAREIGARVNGSPEFMARYGEFLTTPDGVAGQAPFRNVTLAPHFPWVGEVAADLYGQVTGREVDGVIAVDPFVVAALLEYTGEIPLTSVPFALDADNASEFLLRDQYAVAGSNVERIDALEEAARSTFQALLAGSMPDPAELARDLGPLVADRRLLVWTADPAEQDLLQRVGLLGDIPRPQGAAGWAVVVSNAGGSKIDSYLQRRASYAHTTDPETGQTTATLRVELTNTAPASGLPDYVIGNERNLPLGTSRLLLSVYSSLPLTDAMLDGAPFQVSPDLEETWNVYSRFIEIPAGGTVALQFDFAGRLDRPDDVVTWTQPLALPLQPLE